MKTETRLQATACLLLAVCFLQLAACGGKEEPAALPEQVEMVYFYDEICGSCDGTEEFSAIMAEALAGVRDTYPYSIQTINVFEDGGREQYEETAASLGMDTAGLQLPLLVVGGKVLQGHEAIEKGAEEAYLVAGEDLFVNGFVYSPPDKKTGDALFEDYSVESDSLALVYFYRIVCDECNATKPVIDTLLAEAEAAGVKVELVPINTRSANNDERVAAFFSAYEVPDDDRMVPIIFYKNGYLAGYDAISGGLAAVLADDANTGFTFPG